MNQKYLGIGIYTLILISASVASTRYFWPRVQTSIKIEEREVIKKDIRTIIREVKRKDGSSETVTEIIDRGTEKRNKDTQIVTLKRKDWFLAVGAHTDFKGVDPIYSFQANRRILGPGYLGVQVKTDREVGVLVGLEF